MCCHRSWMPSPREPQSSLALTTPSWPPTTSGSSKSFIIYLALSFQLWDAFVAVVWFVVNICICLYNYSDTIWTKLNNRGMLKVKWNIEPYLGSRRKIFQKGVSVKKYTDWFHKFPTCGIAPPAGLTSWYKKSMSDHCKGWKGIRLRNEKKTHIHTFPLPMSSQIWEWTGNASIGGGRHRWSEDADERAGHGQDGPHYADRESDGGACLHEEEPRGGLSLRSSVVPGSLKPRAMFMKGCSSAALS